MANTINAITTGIGGLATTADSSGDISLQSAGSTVVAVTSGGVAVTGTMTVGGNAVLNAGSTVTVAQGGTGRTTSTAYAVICGGTTSTGAQQSVAGLGTAGQVLTSNGTGALPTFQSLPAGGVTSLNGQTGAITNTDFGAIGSYVLANGANNTNYNMNDTIAGSSLQKCSTSSPVSLGSRDMSGAGFGYINTMTSAGLSGTWRSVSVHGNSTGLGGYASTGLWVRIS